MTVDPFLIGALAPLSSPGWSDAGRHLVAGLRRGVLEVNAARGAGGRALALVVRDTAADPARAEAAVDEFADLGVAAIAGEYHSIVAQAAARRATERRVPFLCSSAVIDALTERPTDVVARLCPPQSRGWTRYADALCRSGHERIAIAAQQSAYWTAGIGILRDEIARRGGSIEVLDLARLSASDTPDAVVASGATALLLLAGIPEPAISIVRAVRSDRRLDDVLVGAPAGQPEFAGWARELGEAGAGIPFLRYLPSRLSAEGSRIAAALRDDLGEDPSFVALEGYDTIAVLAAALGNGRFDGADFGYAWSRVDVHGTRGRIRFTREPGAVAWQWAEAPIQVAERERGTARLRAYQP